MDAHNYCAFCGGVAAHIGGHSYHSNAVSEASLQWLGQVRLLFDEAGLPSRDKAVISRRPRCFRRGYYVFEEPTPEEEGMYPDWVSEFGAYGEDCAPPDVSIPIHEACLELFKKYHLPDDLDVEALYLAIGPLSGKNKLRIDYGRITNFQGRRWREKLGQESFVTIPTNIPDLLRYYENLPVLAPEEASTESYFLECVGGASDRLSKLPLELILRILAWLDIGSVNCLRATCKSLANIPTNAFFWKERLRQDQPWLYDFPWDSAPANTDWAAAYRLLLRRSEPSCGAKFLGLANRRRVWGLIDTISVPYMAKKKQRDRIANQELESLKDVSSTYMHQLISPLSRDFRTFTAPLFGDYDELEDQEPVIKTSWTANKELSGMAVLRNPDVEAVTDGYLPDGDTIIDIPVSESHWVASLITYSRLFSASVTQETSQEEHKKSERRAVVGIELLFTDGTSAKVMSQDGDRRYFCPDRDHFIVGFVGQISTASGIARLALLQQARYMIDLTEAHDRMEAQNEDYPDDWHLWRNDATPGADTDWMVHSKSCGWKGYDLTPLESCVFGTTEEELDDIVSISVDGLLGGFQVRYGSRPIRRVGPQCWGMKTLPIDGRGGERITTLIYSANDDRVCFLCFITNRGHQLSVGHFGSRARTFPNAKRAGGAPIGIYAYWSDARMGGIGPLWENTSSPQNAQERAVDAGGLTWELLLHTAIGLRGDGRLVGERVYHNKTMQRIENVPGPNATVSCLDFRNAIDKISATFCHSTPTNKLSLVGLTVIYVGTEQHATVGLTLVTRPVDREGNSMVPNCFCQSDGTPDGELAKPHYVCEAWAVGQKRLTLVRLWLDSLVLVGLQFESEDGHLGPQWGSCNGKPQRQMEFGPDLGMAAGMKVFFDSNNRPNACSDSVVVAVQALQPVQQQSEGNADA